MRICDRCNREVTPYERFTHDCNSARNFAKTWILPKDVMLVDADYEFAEAYAAWLKDGATVGENAGCEKHQNFKSYGDWCPPCLMDELQEAKKILRETWRSSTDDMLREQVKEFLRGEL